MNFVIFEIPTENPRYFKFNWKYNFI